MNKKQELVNYGEMLHEKDLVIGAGGNISVRNDNGFIIKRKFVDMSKGTKADYISVGFDHLAQTEDIVSSETALHIKCYKAQGEIGAVIHVHSPYMVAVSEQVKALQSTSYEFDCVIGDDVPVIEYIQPGSEALAEATEKLITEGHSAILLRRHGGLSVGQDLEQAYLRILALDRACLTYLFGANNLKK